MIDWQYIFGVINSFVIIITLLILIIQTRIFSKQVVILQEQTKAALEASSAMSHSQFYDTLLRIDDMFLEKPHLRKYFYEGVPLGENCLNENSVLFAEAEAAAEKILDIMEHVLRQAALFPEFYVHEQAGKILWEEAHKFFIDLFTLSPLLMAYVEKRRNWYSPQLIEEMESAKQILNQRNNASGS